MLGEVLQGQQLRVQQGQEQELNQATENAARTIIEEDRQSIYFIRLVAMLEARPQADPPTKAQRQEIEALLAACQLGNKGLESRVRKCLGLDRSKQECSEKTMQKALGKTLISQIMAAAGTSHERAKRALENSGGNADDALVMLLSEREANAVKAQEATREKAEKAARNKEKAAKDRVAEAKKIAMTVASLAASTQRMAWAQVQIEFEAQLNVWQTQAMLSAASGGHSVSYAVTQREVEGVLAAAAREPSGTALLLEHALQNAVETGLELCTGVLMAADGVLGAEQVAQNRRRLAAKLHDVGKLLEAGLPVQHDAAEAKELPTLVSVCQLKDSNLAFRAESLLDPGNVSL